MDHTKDNDGDLVASEAQELLPLYAETDPATSTGATEPPTADATPAEVRAFLVSLLERRGVGPEDAKARAAKWTIGTGTELREYNRDVFIGIFGAEDGWVIHKDVQTSLAPGIAREWQEKKQARLAKILARKWQFIAVFVAGVTVLTLGMTLSSVSLIFAGIPVTLVGTSAVCVLVLAYLGH